ncbi:MAG: hypothetical protein Ct9H300mP14_06600 [Gammaproteobacteria bacterium]|nr:MAG: hypothetical protein Ct9H300mP14_06600 [Gammaproteobacteria bacterium]
MSPDAGQTGNGGKTDNAPAPLIECAPRPITASTSRSTLPAFRSCNPIHRRCVFTRLCKKKIHHWFFRLQTVVNPGRVQLGVYRNLSSLLRRTGIIRRFPRSVCERVIAVHRVQTVYRYTHRHREIRRPTQPLFSAVCAVRNSNGIKPPILVHFDNANTFVHHSSRACFRSIMIRLGNSVSTREDNQCRAKATVFLFR